LIAHDDPSTMQNYTLSLHDALPIFTSQSETHPRTGCHTIDSCNNRLWNLFQCFHHWMVSFTQYVSIICIFTDAQQILTRTESFLLTCNHITTYFPIFGLLFKC